MTKHLCCFIVEPLVPMEVAWQELENEGVELAYGTEEDGSAQIYGYLLKGEEAKKRPFIARCEPTELPEIDWESQWKEHGLNFEGGYVNVYLKDFGFESDAKLKLKPGPGFGDLSHPTTSLVLQLMAQYACPGACFVDVGCGSGILALAAAAMHYYPIYGIDIDEQALKHSVENARINHMENHIVFGLPQEMQEPFTEPLIVAMNMIQMEQIAAYQSLPALQEKHCIWLTSGIREEDFQKYLECVKGWHWELLHKREREGWVGCAFICRGKN